MTTRAGPRQGAGIKALRCIREQASRVRATASALPLALILLAVVPSQAADPISAGALYAFGYNGSGQLGNTTGNGSNAANPTPVLVSLPGATGPVTQVAAGQLHSLVLTAGDQLYAFGANHDGELGNTANMGLFDVTATPTLVSLPGQSGRIRQIAAGRAGSFVLTSTGQLYAFGNNHYGQLGIAANIGTDTANTTPALVTLPGATGPPVQVAAGGNHALVLTSTGQLYAFGFNDFGELGVAANSGTANPNPTPALVTLPGATGSVVQIAAGGEHSLALTGSGQLYAFGLNDYGQLGNTTNNTALTANPVPTLVSLPGATGAIAEITAGDTYSLVLTSSGQIYGFGYNFEGQLGTPVNTGTSAANPTPLLASLPDASGRVIHVSAGNYQSYALTSTGKLYSFGDNDYGELGVSLGTGIQTPDFPAGTTIETMARGSQALHALAVVANLQIVSPALPAARVGDVYRADLAASGGSGADTWAATGLPAGLGIDGNSGQISGTPSAAASASVVITVTDADGISASSTLPLAVTGVTTTTTTTTTATTTVSAAKLKASLLAQLAPKGKAAKIAALLKKKTYAASFKALRAGVLVIDWYYLPKGARLSGTKIKPVLVAQGRRTFASARTLTVTVKLTAKGRQMLKQARRLAITTKGIFTAKGAAAVTTTRTASLTR